MRTAQAEHAGNVEDFTNGRASIPTLRIGLIGSGFIANFHLQALLSVRPESSVSTLVGMPSTWSGSPRVGSCTIARIDDCHAAATRASSFSYAQGVGLRNFNAIINALLFIRQQTSVINAIRAHLADFGVIAPSAPDFLSGFRRPAFGHLQRFEHTPSHFRSSPASRPSVAPQHLTRWVTRRHSRLLGVSV